MECNYLSVLSNDILLDSMCEFASDFGAKERKDKLQLLVTYHRYARPSRNNCHCFLLPCDTIHARSIPTDYKICISALMSLCGIGKGVWSTVCDIVQGRRSRYKHGLKGQPSNRKRKPDDRIIVELNEHFGELETFGEVQATRFVQEETGEVTLRDQEDNLIYLPTNMPKRYCYNRYCKDRGYRVKTSCKGTTTLEQNGQS